MSENEKFPYIVMLLRPGRVSHVRTFHCQAADDGEAEALAMRQHPGFTVAAIRSYFEAQPRVLIRVGSDDTKSPPEPLYLSDNFGATIKAEADCYLPSQLDDRYIPASQGIALEFL